MAGVKKLQVLNFPNLDEIDPDAVIFPEGLNTTYAIGKVQLTNGMGTLVEPGGTLTDFFNIFVDEKNPSTTQPSVSLTFSQAKAYEVGTKLTPTYSASLNPGKYTYGPDTGIVATAWEVTDTNGNSSTTASGEFNELQVVDNINYKITATATYNDGAIPVTNIGNEYAEGQIIAGSKSATSKSVTGYRNVFYGTLTEKTDLTSDVIRSLPYKSGKALATGDTFNIPIPVGALRTVFAYDTSIRNDGGSSVKDVNFSNIEISSGFTITDIPVEGANGYDAVSYQVYYIDRATANDTENIYIVTI